MTTAEQYGMVKPTGTDEMTNGDDAISQNADATAAALDVLHGLLWPRPALLRDEDFNTITTPGPYSVGQLPTSAAAATAANMPLNATGTLEVLPVGSARLQRFTTYTTPARVFIRLSGSVNVSPITWGAWAERTVDLYATLNPALAVNPNFNNVLTYGTHHIAANPTVPYADLNWPTGSRGALTVSKIGSSYLQTYLTYDVVPQLWARRSSGTVFSAWARLDAGAVVVPAAPAASTAPPAGSGMKRVGVPITAGHSGSDAPLTANVRMPLKYGAPIARFRLRLQDINPRSGITRTGQVTLSGLWLGTHTGAGAMTGAVQLLGPVTIPDAGTEYRSPWFNVPLTAGTEYLLSFGYTKASAPWAMLGHSYQTADPADAGTGSPAGRTKLGTAPFSLAIEAETYIHTPVIASLGDSNSVGVGAANGLHDSWLSQLCRRLGALPDHRGSSGDTCSNSLTASMYKYTRFSDLARPDAAILALGQNDAAVTDVTAAEITPRIKTVLDNLAAAVSPNLYAVNYMPRTVNPWTGFEQVRRELSAHLLTQPAGLRDVFDIAAAISGDDETILPTFDADGTHLNAAGFAQVQAAITRPVTTPAVQYA